MRNPAHATKLQHCDRLLTLVLLLHSIPDVYAAETILQTNTPCTAGDQIVDIAAVDIDGDGNIDLITANSWSFNISVLMNNGAGMFASPTNYGSLGFPNSLATADFNCDGWQDVAVSEYLQHKVSLLLNQTNGVLGSPLPFEAVDLPEPGPIAAADFNEDGHPDLAVMNGGGSFVGHEGPDCLRLLMGNGDGTFQAGEPIGSNKASFVIADLNADSHSDFVTGSSYDQFGTNDQFLYVYLGNGNASFTNVARYFLDYRPGCFAVGDMDEDGMQDVVTTTGSTGGFYFLKGNGDGTFSTITHFYGGVPYGAAEPVLGDFNCDSHLDVAWRYPLANKVGVALGNGDGTFTHSYFDRAYDAPASSGYCLVGACLNGDTVPDLAAGEESNGSRSPDRVYVYFDRIDDVPWILSVSNAGDRPAISWTSLSNRLYDVYLSSNLLTDFSCITSNLLGNHPHTSYTDQVDRATSFYRVGVRAPK